MGRKAIVLYCALALALSWAIQIALLATVGLESDFATPALVVGMWSPTILALIFIAFHKPARQGVRWGPGNPFYWPLGILFATGLAFGAVALFTSQGWGSNDWFDFSSASVLVNGGPWVLGKGEQAWPFFVGNVLATAGLFAVTNLVAAAGEEFAWRGFLQGHLVRQFGISGGVLILGLFWAAWHLPVMLSGYNQPDAPILGAFVITPLDLVFTSFFYAWLTIRSGSFWPAALAHGAGNSIQEGVISHMTLSVPDLWADLFCLVPTIAVGLFCWMALEGKRRRDAARTARREAYA